ncbi:hypothetical protein ACGFNU_30435 [Spirillospora sp. NPDC048911]|uniref:hypothetical protein n=1 Tax=Spirillospora sp. NPDC048911 TaxID=3364527 RepID=UPI00371ABF94
MSQLDQAVAEAQEIFAILARLMAEHGISFLDISTSVQHPVGLEGVAVAMAYEQWARKLNTVAALLAHQEGIDDSSSLSLPDRQRLTVAAFSLVQEAS